MPVRWCVMIVILRSTSNLVVNIHLYEGFQLYNCSFSSQGSGDARANGFLIKFSLFFSFVDELVLLGNHRDAWVFGAADASSGTAAMMEVSRVLGEQLKKGTARQQ